MNVCEENNFRLFTPRSADFVVRGSYHPEMTDRRVGPLVLWMARVAAVVGFVVVLSAAFRTGWTRISTDFPNYYIGRRGGCATTTPLPNLYDWTWFARQMNYAGIENQLGGYVPQSPATMLPMIPIAGFPPLTAKRIWLVLNLILLLAVIGILARMTGVRWEYLTILLLCGYRSLMTNFIYGQYYIFLLFLLTLTLYTFARNRDSLSGFLCGATFAMKLYPGPLLIYFAAKRAWTQRARHGGRRCVCGRRRAAAVRMERHRVLPDARSAANAGGQFRRSI